MGRKRMVRRRLSKKQVEGVPNVLVFWMLNSTIYGKSSHLGGRVLNNLGESREDYMEKVAQVQCGMW